MSTPLEELADAADRAARDQRRIASTARRLGRERRQGASWSDLLDRDERPGLVQLVAQSARHVTEMTNRFRHSLVKALTSEGLSTRDIARRLGVSHQRISAMLRRGS